MKPLYVYLLVFAIALSLCAQPAGRISKPPHPNVATKDFVNRAVPADCVADDVLVRCYAFPGGLHAPGPNEAKDASIPGAVGVMEVPYDDIEAVDMCEANACTGLTLWKDIAVFTEVTPFPAGDAANGHARFNRRYHLVVFGNTRTLGAKDPIFIVKKFGFAEAMQAKAALRELPRMGRPDPPKPVNRPKQ